MTDDQTNTDPTTDEAQQVDDEGLDLTPEEWATAAEQMGEEAAQAQDDPAGSVEADEANSTPREQRYRQRAHTAEAERDQLSALVDGMRRAEVERLAAPRLADPSDVFRDGATLADVIDDEGRVDPGKLGALIDGLIDQHPHWVRPVAPYRGPLFSGATNTRQIDAPGKGFADAFTPQAD
jgi:hypothetical protein